MGRVRCRRWEPRGAPGAVLPAGRLARVRAAHPTPRARHLLRPKGNNRSGAPFRLASRREPNFLYLGPGGGLYAKGAHPDCQADSGPAGGEERRGWALPEPTPPRGGNPESQGQLGRAELSSCCRMTPLPRPTGRPLPGALAATPGGAARAGGAVPAAKPQNSGSPRPPRLAALGIPVCFPVPGADARAAIVAFLYPLQKEGESRAGGR